MVPIHKINKFKLPLTVFSHLPNVPCPEPPLAVLHEEGLGRLLRVLVVGVGNGVAAQADLTWNENTV